ncbi:MAG: hypothetical protein M0Q91_16755 [Methanoregula sp.]|jgi:hypothetical protein|nr:hypothetical protein [Methanoregula sp.]
MNEQSENSVENQEPGPAGSGEQGTGQNSTNPGDARTAKRIRTSPPLVERVTALRGQSIARLPEPKSTLRRQTQVDIYGRDAEVPYVKFEAAARDLVCSLMERQDRMNEEIFYKLNDLAYRVEDLEENRTREGSGE